MIEFQQTVQIVCVYPIEITLKEDDMDHVRNALESLPHKSDLTEQINRM